jgi:hypothetical protein
LVWSSSYYARRRHRYVLLLLLLPHNKQDEEERYARCLIHSYAAGLFELPRGQTLRFFIAAKLRCSPMRVTKKFPGSTYYSTAILARSWWTGSTSQHVWEAGRYRVRMAAAVCILVRLTISMFLYFSWFRHETIRGVTIHHLPQDGDIHRRQVGARLYESPRTGLSRLHHVW